MTDHPFITDKAVQACREEGWADYEEPPYRDILNAFVAHHEGERPCERCVDGYVPQVGSCRDCNGNGKVRADRLVKLSEVVEAMRKKATAEPDSVIQGSMLTLMDHIERIFGGDDA